MTAPTISTYRAMLRHTTPEPGFRPVVPNMGLAGLVACLIQQADWWTHSMGPLVHVAIVPKTYPIIRDHIISRTLEIL